MADDAPHAETRRRPPRLLNPGVGRIRRKLILLHTLFSISLATSLLLVVRSPIRDLISTHEGRECVLALAAWQEDPEQAREMASGIRIRRGSALDLAIPSELAVRARAKPGEIQLGVSFSGWPVAVVYRADSREYLASAVQSRVAQTAVNRLYLLIIAAILAAYGFIALTLEVLILPRQVYAPIERLRQADAAVQEGLREAEIIPDDQIPNDELGEIMRSRNQSIRKLRDQEQRLEQVLDHVEVVASELKRKNHLLETARQNLAEQDRLVSLGMMSAGIAHELNTPLAVLKGSVEMIKEHPDDLDDERIDLMLRVIKRLERLSESLLDFARARPPVTERLEIQPVVAEAWTLVSLDRDARGVEFVNCIETHLTASGDADRLTQVFVNLLRNANDAMNGVGRIEANAEVAERDGAEWVSILISDNGPGIDPAVMPRLFEPFASTRLDAQGTGLGLAVAEGIIKEHGGIILARNRPDGGSTFEVMLPRVRVVAPADGSEDDLLN